MADWAGNDTGPGNDVGGGQGTDVGSSSASNYGGGGGGGNAVGSAEWWSAEIAGREAAAAANIQSNPTGGGNSGGEIGRTYTDPRTGQTFANQKIAEGPPVGSPQWWTQEIAARESAAMANTQYNPISPTSPGYREYVAPSNISAQRVAAAQQVQQNDLALPGPMGMTVTSINRVGETQGLDLPGPRGVVVTSIERVGSVANQAAYIPTRMAPVSSGTGLDFLGFGLLETGKAWSKNTEDFFSLIQGQIPSNPVIAPVTAIPKAGLGFVEAAPQLAAFVPLVLGSAYVFGRDPTWGVQQIIPTASNSFTSTVTRAIEQPERMFGNILGSVAIPEVAIGATPVGIISKDLPAGNAVYPSAESVWVQSKISGSPVIQGIVDQFGFFKDSKAVTTVNGLWVGGSIDDPAFVAGIVSGHMTPPELFAGKTTAVNIAGTGIKSPMRGLYDILSETFIENDAEFAVGRAAPKSVESALMNEFFAKTATDNFTRSLVEITGVLERSELLDLKAATLAGFPEQAGMSFNTRLGIMDAFQKAGPNAVIIGSSSFPILLGPEHARTEIGISSDIDSSVTLEAMNPMQKQLQQVFDKTGIYAARNTIADATLAVREPGVVAGEINWGILSKYMTPEGIYRIPTGFSAHSLPGSARLTPQEIAATELLVRKTGSPGLYEFVDYENKLSRASEKLDIMPMQPLGTFQHAALTPEAQREVFRTLSGLGTNVQAIGSFQFPNMWGPEAFPKGIEKSDIDLDISRRYMTKAAEQMALGMRANLPRPMPSILPKQMVVDTDLLLGLSEQGKNIGFGGRIKGGIAPLEEPSSKGFHIAEVGVAADTDRIIGAQAMEITFGVRTKMYPSIGGEIKAQTPESYILSQLSRSFGESKKGQEMGYWEYDPNTGKTRLVTVSPKAEKDITRIYATSKGIASSALDLGDMPVAARYARFADVMSDVGKQMGIDVYGSTQKDILADKNIPSVTPEIEPSLILDQPLGALAIKPLGKNVEPLTRGFSFSPRNGEHVLGAQQLEGHPEVKFSMVPSIAGGSIALQTLKNAIEMKLSRLSGSAKYVHTPSDTIDIKSGKIIPAGTRVVEGLGGSKPSTDLIDVITGLGKIAKEAREQGYSELATEATATKMVFTSKLRGEFGIDIKDVVQEPLMIRTLPGSSGYRIMGPHPALNKIIPEGTRLRVEPVGYSEVDAVIANMMGFPEPHSLRAIPTGTKPTPEQIEYYSAKYGTKPLQTYTFAEPLVESKSNVALSKTYPSALETMGERALVVVPSVADYVLPTSVFPTRIPVYATYGSFLGIREGDYQGSVPYPSTKVFDSYQFITPIVSKEIYSPVLITDNQPDYGIYPGGREEKYTPYRPYPGGREEKYTPYRPIVPPYEPYHPGTPGTPGYPLTRLPHTPPPPTRWPWESRSEKSEFVKKKRKPQSSYIFREILPVITPIEEVGGFKSGKSFFRAIGNQQILEVKPQTRDYLHYVDVDQDVRELRQKETADKVSDMAGVSFYRAATKQEKAKTGKPILAYTPTQQELNMAKLTGISNSKPKKGRRMPWF
jgi:hypothetical protein